MFCCDGAYSVGYVSFYLLRRTMMRFAFAYPLFNINPSDRVIYML